VAACSPGGAGRRDLPSAGTLLGGQARRHHRPSQPRLASAGGAGHLTELCLRLRRTRSPAPALEARAKYLGLAEPGPRTLLKARRHGSPRAHRKSCRQGLSNRPRRSQGRAWARLRNLVAEDDHHVLGRGAKANRDGGAKNLFATQRATPCGGERLVCAARASHERPEGAGP
jgi:hypothetical protein